VCVCECVSSSRDAFHASAVYAAVITSFRLSVRLSVKLVDCIKMIERLIRLSCVMTDVQKV